MMARKLRVGAIGCALLLWGCGGGATPETVVTSGSATRPSTSVTAPTTTSTSVVATTKATTTTSTAPAPSTTGDLALVHRALTDSAEALPARIEGLLSMSGTDPELGSVDLEMPISIAYDSATGHSSFSMDLSGMAQAGGEELPPELLGMFGEMEMRQLGDIAYVRFPFFSQFFGAETDWVSMPAEEGDSFADDFTSSTPSDPTAFLESLSDADGAVEKVGEETLRGIETTRYRVVFDAASWRDQLSAEELAELEEQGPIPLSELPVEIWIDADGLVHRYAMEVDGSQVEPMPPGEDFEHMTMQFDFYDFGGSTTIEPPPADQVTDIEDLPGPFGSVPTP